MAKSKELTKEEWQERVKHHLEARLNVMRLEAKRWGRLSEEEQEHFRQILLRKRGTRAHCPGCGERFNRDNFHVCTKCGEDYCFRCVWQLEEFGEEGDHRWRCSCGGEAL